MLVRYDVEYWDELDDEEKSEKGIASAVTLGTAVDKVCEFYGKENIVKIAVYEIEGILADYEIRDMVTE